MEYDADIFDAVEFGDLESIKTYWTDQINIDWQDGDGMDSSMDISFSVFTNISLIFAPIGEVEALNWRAFSRSIFVIKLGEFSSESSTKEESFSLLITPLNSS